MFYLRVPSDFTKCEVLNYRIGDHETLKMELNFKVPKADKFKCVSIRDHSKQNIESLHYYLKELNDYTDSNSSFKGSMAIFEAFGCLKL